MEVVGQVKGMKGSGTLYTIIKILQPLLEKVFSTLATSTPVECVFSQSCLINDHASQSGKASEKLLSQLVFLKSNNHPRL